MSAGAAVPTGNTYDKYGSTNPVVRRLMRGFEADLDDLLERAAPTSIVDVGCGEGVLSARWAARPRINRVLGVDLDDAGLRGHWQMRRVTGLEFASFDGRQIPAGDEEFELAAAIEVLEHVPDPSATLEEMARVARGHLLVSVPREPVWRGLNLLRGAYLVQLGNTPGHINHWTRRGLLRLLARHGEVVGVRSPFPWTMALVRL